MKLLQNETLAAVNAWLVAEGKAAVSNPGARYGERVYSTAVPAPGPRRMEEQRDVAVTGAVNLLRELHRLELEEVSAGGKAPQYALTSAVTSVQVCF